MLGDLIAKALKDAYDWFRGQNKPTPAPGDQQPPVVVQAEEPKESRA